MPRYRKNMRKLIYNLLPPAPGPPEADEGIGGEKRGVSYNYPLSVTNFS